LVISIIIRIFVLTLEGSVKSGCGEQPLKLNQRQPAL